MISSSINTKVIALSASSSMISIWFFDINERTLTLGVLGFIVSFFSFLHAYARNEKNDTFLEIVSELFKFIIFGTVAFPAAYSYLSRFIEEQEILVAGGIFSSYFIVTFLDILVKKGKDMIFNWKRT